MTEVLSTLSWGEPVPFPGVEEQPIVPGCSVVVCTQRRPLPLRRFLGSIRDQGVDIDRLVVVDASPDRSTEQMLLDSGILDGLARSSLYFLVGDSLRGLTRQRNFGADRVRTDLVAFFDDDVVLQPGCLEALVSAHRCDDRVVGTGAVAVNQLSRPALLWRTKESVRAVADLRPGSYQRSGMSVPWGFLDPRVETCGGDWLPGCAMMWRSEIVRRERFNEDLTGYAQGEDLEFSLRAKRHGALTMVGAARVLHLRDDGAGRPSGFRVGYMAIRNKYRIHRDCLVDRRFSDVLWFVYAWTIDTLMYVRFLREPRAWRHRISEVWGRIRAAIDIVREPSRNPPA